MNGTYSAHHYLVSFAFAHTIVKREVETESDQKLPEIPTVPVGAHLVDGNKL